MFQFELIGRLRPQKQTRFTCPCKKGHAYDPSKKDKEMIQWQIKNAAPQNPYCGPVSLHLEFHFPIPIATSKIKYAKMINHQIFPDIKPDVDNLAYLITNAMKGIVYDDDKRICEMHVYKYYATKPRVLITVTPLYPLALSDATYL